MSMVDQLLANLRNNGVLYLVCIFGIIGAFKLLDDFPKQKKFVLIGIGLLLGSSIGGTLLNGILYEGIVGPMPMHGGDFQKHAENLRTYSTMSGIVWFISGAAHAAGVASILYAIFVDKFTVSAKRSPRRSRRDDRDDDDYDRPRGRRSRRDDDDDDDDRPPARSRRDQD